MFASTRNCNTSPHDEDNVVDALCRCELVELGGHRRPSGVPFNSIQRTPMRDHPNQTYTPYGSDAYNNGYCTRRFPTAIMRQSFLSNISVVPFLKLFSQLHCTQVPYSRSNVDLRAVPDFSVLPCPIPCSS